MKNEKVLFRVSTRSNPHKISEAIYKTYLEGKNLEIQAIGAGAVNQAVKSIAIAQSKLSLTGKYVAVILGFRDVPGEQKVKRDQNPEGMISAINFTIISLRGNGE
jgi:stage V sporulation protein S